MNALIAADSLPDILTLGVEESAVNQIIEEEMVYALNELGEKYDMYFFEATNPDIRKWFTRDDGNIYGYPGFSVTPEDFKREDEIYANQNFLVRKDIYEAIGSPDMTTQEGFYKAVKRAVELFPEVDGKPLIPIGANVFDKEGCASFDDCLMNFLAVPYEKDGKYYDRYTDDEYISWLKFFRRLSEEGYLLDDIFIDQKNQIEEKFEQGRYFCMLYQSEDVLNQQKAACAQNSQNNYVAVDGPKNAAGDDYQLPCSGINGYTVTMISKNCKHPKRAIAFLDYLISEHGQALTYLGVEGETYDVIEGRPVVREEVRELLSTNRREYDKKYGADNAYWMLQNSVMQLKWKQERSDVMMQPKQWTCPYVVYSSQYDSLTLTRSRFINMSSKITELWSETLPYLLLAQTEERFDKILQDFVKKREELGFEDLESERTKLMESAKKKLGMR